LRGRGSLFVAGSELFQLFGQGAPLQGKFSILNLHLKMPSAADAPFASGSLGAALFGGHQHTASSFMPLA
jgi:hypothetical protein